MIRPMAFRHWYAGDCRRQIAEFLAGFTPATGLGVIQGAMVPHAGWRYSGHVAARTFRTLAESAPESLILFSAVHRSWLRRPALYPQGAWETPVGHVEVDEELAREILDALEGFVIPEPQAHADEHALEVQMPLIRVLLPGVRVVPIMAPPEAQPHVLGERIAEIAGERNVAAVASSDLTHYGDVYGFTPAGYGPSAHAWMRENDRRLLRLIEELRAEEIVPEALRHHNACGPGAIAAAVAYARARGARRGYVIEHTDSHEVEGRPGPFTMAVGYAGVVFA